MPIGPVRTRSDSGDSPERHHLRLPRILLLLLVAIVAYCVAIAVLIVRQSDRDEAQPADVIVVFGAAEYAGHPSPIFRARLDHAYTLFQRGLAPFVITTGGSGNDVRFTEGGVGLTYLERRGIPAGHLFAESEARNTGASAESVAMIMSAHGMKTCIAVSDGYHLFRIKHMMARQGVQAYGSPRAEIHEQGAWQEVQQVGREIISYTLWKLHIT
ncbi:MAG TPA: YdcF family protein [Terriglobales bacterium]|nr:YdcF family protein [Terriglobales bacterium]